MTRRTLGLCAVVVLTLGIALLPLLLRTNRAAATGGAAPTITIEPAPSTPGSPNPNPDPAPTDTDVEFKFIVNLTGSPLASGELVFSSTGTITDVLLPPEWVRQADPTPGVRKYFRVYDTGPTPITSDMVIPTVNAKFTDCDQPARVTVDGTVVSPFGGSVQTSGSMTVTLTPGSLAVVLTSVTPNPARAGEQATLTFTAMLTRPSTGPTPTFTPLLFDPGMDGASYSDPVRGLVQNGGSTSPSVVITVDVTYPTCGTARPELTVQAQVGAYCYTIVAGGSSITVVCPDCESATLTVEPLGAEFNPTQVGQVTLLTWRAKLDGTEATDTEFFVSVGFPMLDEGGAMVGQAKFVPDPNDPDNLNVRLVQVKAKWSTPSPTGNPKQVILKVRAVFNQDSSPPCERAEESEPMFVAVEAVAKLKIRYLKRGEGNPRPGRGTLGDLTDDNPTGFLPDDDGNPVFKDGIPDGTPEFKGGFRFFPDAADYTNRTELRNIIRIRVAVPKEAATRTVYFRSFDVDDPNDSNSAIDGNDFVKTPAGEVFDERRGRDNRGRLSGADFEHIQKSVRPEARVAKGKAGPRSGYDGALRPVLRGADGSELVVVEQFAVRDPPDVLEVEAVLFQDELVAEVELRTTVAPGDNFRIAAALNKAAILALDPEVGVPTEVTPETRDESDAFDAVVYTPQLMIWRRFHIDGHAMTPPAGDFAGGAITKVAAAPFGLKEFVVETTVNTGKQDEYAGGILRTGGANYHIVANSGGNGALFYIIADQAPVAGLVTVYQDDYVAGPRLLANRVIAPVMAQPPAPDANGFVTLKTSTYAPALDVYKDGFLRVTVGGGVGPTDFVVKGNSAGRDMEVTIVPIAGKPINKDDKVSVFAKLNNDVPRVRADTSADAALYTMLRPTTHREENRFADACLEPAYDLDEINVLQPGAKTHLLDNDFVDHFADARFLPLDNDPLATDTYWVVYLSTAYQFAQKVDGDADNDPDTEGGQSGWSRRKGQFAAAAAFLETSIDLFHHYLSVGADIDVPPELTPDVYVAKVAVHEVGHLFFGLSPDLNRLGHRDDGLPNIMQTDSPLVKNDKFYFDPLEIAKLRERIRTPLSVSPAAE